jgi:hypothetical protein
MRGENVKGFVTSFILGVVVDQQKKGRSQELLKYLTFARTPHKRGGDFQTSASSRLTVMSVACDHLLHEALLS